MRRITVERWGGVSLSDGGGGGSFNTGYLFAQRLKVNSVGVVASAQSAYDAGHLPFEVYGLAIAPESEVRAVAVREPHAGGRMAQLLEGAPLPIRLEADADELVLDRSIVLDGYHDGRLVLLAAETPAEVPFLPVHFSPFREVTFYGLDPTDNSERVFYMPSGPVLAGGGLASGSGMIYNADGVGSGTMTFAGIVLASRGGEPASGHLVTNLGSTAIAAGSVSEIALGNTLQNGCVLRVSMTAAVVGPVDGIVRIV